MQYPQLLSRYPIISDQINQPALAVVLRELEAVLEQGIDGDVAEFGCYIGTTSVFIRRLLDTNRQNADRKFYVYDSFAGLPAKALEDNSSAGIEFKAGELTVSKKQFIQTFQKANLTLPVVTKAWFADLTDRQLPTDIAYAFLDGDFYESIIDSLKLVWPRLSAGGTITIDDYNRPALPGVTKAVSDFFGTQNVNLHHEHGIAIITKGL